MWIIVPLVSSIPPSTYPRPHSYVLPNHMMFQIAEILPREPQGILACCNPIPPLIRQNLQEVSHLVQKSREVSLSEPLPSSRPQPHPPQRSRWGVVPPEGSATPVGRCFSGWGCMCRLWTFLLFPIFPRRFHLCLLHMEREELKVRAEQVPTSV